VSVSPPYHEECALLYSHPRVPRGLVEFGKMSRLPRLGTSDLYRQAGLLESHVLESTHSAGMQTIGRCSPLRPPQVFELLVRARSSNSSCVDSWLDYVQALYLTHSVRAKTAMVMTVLFPHSPIEPPTAAVPMQG